MVGLAYGKRVMLPEILPELLPEWLPEWLPELLMCAGEHLCDPRNTVTLCCWTPGNELADLAGIVAGDIAGIVGGRLF
jgi:hypothetical protein